MHIILNSQFTNFQKMYRFFRPTLHNATREQRCASQNCGREKTYENLCELRASLR